MSSHKLLYWFGHRKLESDQREGTDTHTHAYRQILRNRRRNTDTGRKRYTIRFLLLLVSFYF